MEQSEFYTRENAESTPERYRTLFFLSETEKESLRQRIEKWKGRVRIFVHPYYDTHKREEQWSEHQRKLYEENKKTVAIKKVLIDLLSMDELKTPPIFIMEESSHSEDIVRIISEAGSEIKNPPYLIKTKSNTARPLGSGDFQDWEMADQAWDELATELKELGVNSIFIAGMYLNIEKDVVGDKEKISYEACVGQAYTRLSKSFDVELSTLTEPDTRLDIKDIPPNSRGRSYIV